MASDSPCRHPPRLHNARQPLPTARLGFQITQANSFCDIDLDRCRAAKSADHICPSSREPARISPRNFRLKCQSARWCPLWPLHSGNPATPLDFSPEHRPSEDVDHRMRHAFHPGLHSQQRDQHRVVRLAGIGPNGRLLSPYSPKNCIANLPRYAVCHGAQVAPRGGR